MKREAFLVLVILAAVGCDGQQSVVAPDPSPAPRAYAAGPADGSGNKQVISYNVSNPVTCPNGTILTRNVTGWVQIITFEGTGNRNLELDVFHNDLTFSNTAGETFTFLDVGPDHHYTVGDELFVAITGRSTASLVIGHVVINVTTGATEFEAGQEFEPLRLEACAELS